MANESKCLKCGAPLTPDARDGVCPRCLLALAFASESGGESSDAAPSPPVITEGPGTIIGRYKLLERIGEGGFGVVYMAEQEEPVRRRVALKIIKLGMDTKEVIARFEAERQALALMDHPNIAKVFDGGATDTGRPYFVMELVRGIRITEFCDQKNLSTQQRLDLLMQVCQAVQHAHQKGIIHRDLKPSNILVTVNDGVPVPKVIDFGIAKATGMRLTDKTLFTRFLHLLGTPAYMSPEQVEWTSLDVDTRSDIYSLGVLLYELLTGRTPFDAQELWQAGVVEMRRRIREEEPPKPSTRLSTLTDTERTTAGKCRSVEGPKLTHLVRGDLDWIVMKCLEKERNRRYETASGLAMDLQRYLNDEPVVAGPPTVRYRARKFVRKHRKAVAVAAGFVVLLAVASIVSTGLALWANRERKEKEIQRQLAEHKAAAESIAKAEAQLLQKRTEEALTKMQIQQAEYFFSADDSPRAVAHLARVLSRDRSNRVAAERLLSALTIRKIGLLVTKTKPLRHEGSVRSARFSPDGRRVVTVSEDKTARVWDAQTGTPITESLRHEGPVSSAQFSPDGRRVVTASKDKTARVWDAQTGTPITESLRHEGPVSSAEFSPDGRRVVTASSDKTARVWDAQTGQPLTEPLRHDDLVVSAHFSPDGRRVVTVSDATTARVWNSLSGELLAETLRHDEEVKSAQFSPDGRRLVTAAFDSARVWDALTGQPLTGPLRHEYETVVYSAEFSPDGLRVITASSDGTARIWDAQTGKPITEPLRHDYRVLSARFSPDGRWVITSSDGTRIWDAHTGQPLTEPLRHVYAAEFSPDGLRVLAFSSSGAAQVWDAQTDKLLTEPLRHRDSVYAAQFSPDGRRVVTASADRTARVWDAQTGKPITEPLRHNNDVGSAHFSPDGRWVVTASYDKTARVWDAQTGTPITGPLQHEGPVTSAQFSPDGQWVVTACGGSNGYARVWDTQTGQPITGPLQHKGWVYSAQFSPDGLRVVTAASDSARVWDALTGQPLTGPLRHEYEEVGYSAEFSPDGFRVVTGSYDKTARVWDAQTGQPLTELLRHGGWIESARFSADGRRVVTASSDGTARVWDAQNGKPLTEPLRHEDEVRSARFSRDGLRVVTASHDKTARVWDAQTGQPLTEPLRHEDEVCSAEFSPDGRWVLTASRDGTVRIWEMTFGAEPAPAWLPELAVSVAGKRLTETGIFEPVPPEEFLKLKEPLMQSAETDYYARWAKWFCSDRSTRTLSPLSRIIVPEYVQRRIQNNYLTSLHEAVNLAPTNGLAYARLANRILWQDDERNPRHVGEADFFSRYALKWAPNDAEVVKIRAEIEEQIKRLPKP